MYAIPAESRRSATIARTSGSSVTRAPIDSARRPLESEIAPHPAEVMRGAALLTLTFGTVLHRLQEGDQLRAEALDLHRLARRTPAQRGQRGGGPRAVLPVVEIAEQPRLVRHTGGYHLNRASGPSPRPSAWHIGRGQPRVAAVVLPLQVGPSAEGPVDGGAIGDVEDHPRQHQVVALGGHEMRQRREG